MQMSLVVEKQRALAGKSMKFFKQTLLITVLGVSVAVLINSDCKADGG